MATAGTADKCKVCKDLGADVVIDYKTQDFVEAAKAATGGKGIDVTLDMVGGDYTERNLVIAAEDGRIVQIATLGGPTSTINVARLMVKRVTLTGSTLRPRTRAVKAGFARALEERVWPLLASGQAIIPRHTPLSRIMQAVILITYLRAALRAMACACIRGALLSSGTALLLQVC